MSTVLALFLLSPCQADDVLGGVVVLATADTSAPSELVAQTASPHATSALGSHDLPDAPPPHPHPHSFVTPTRRHGHDTEGHGHDTEQVSRIPDVEVFSCGPEPPEARVRAPRAREPKVKGPFTHTAHSRRLCGSSRGECGRNTVFFANLEPPEARAGSLGEISEGGGSPTPLTASTRGQRQVLRAHLSGKGLFFVSAKPGLPEARAGTLGEGRGRGRVPLAPLLMHFADPKLPEASAGTLGT
ncbi:hypothetical protein EV122DRAFT_284585 [Schizophyllum commune]